jgi:hypothetical protein
VDCPVCQYFPAFRPRCFLSANRRAEVHGSFNPVRRVFSSCFALSSRLAFAASQAISSFVRSESLAKAELFIGPRLLLESREVTEKGDSLDQIHFPDGKTVRMVPLVRAQSTF